MVDEEGVERFVASHQHAERLLAGPAGPAQLLLQRGAGAGEPDADDRVEPGHVDAELERVGAREAEQVAAAQPLLELAPLLRQVAAAVRRHRAGERRVDLVEPSLRPGRDRLGAAPRPDEHQRPGACRRRGR